MVTSMMSQQQSERVYRACGRKRAYIHQHEAEHAIARRAQHPSAYSLSTLAPYQCTYCQLWHIGNSVTNKRTI